uniref:Protein 3 n=1 Tax=Spinach virus 1_Ole TaxID=2977990 RepID=A0A9N6YJF2_9RHAB|nr:TPA_asm: protein 3 [Spinach virus 1_Ole]
MDKQIPLQISNQLTICLMPYKASSKLQYLANRVETSEEIIIDTLKENYKKLDDVLRKYSKLDNCWFCDSTKRIKVPTIEYKNLWEVLNSPLMRIYSHEDIENFKLSDNEHDIHICLDCITKILFSSKPISLMTTMKDHRYPKMIDLPVDYTVELCGEAFSLYTHSTVEYM